MRYLNNIYFVAFLVLIISLSCDKSDDTIPSSGDLDLSEILDNFSTRILTEGEFIFKNDFNQELVLTSTIEQTLSPYPVKGTIVDFPIFISRLKDESGYVYFSLYISKAYNTPQEKVENIIKCSLAPSYNPGTGAAASVRLTYIDGVFDIKFEGEKFENYTMLEKTFTDVFFNELSNDAWSLVAFNMEQGLVAFKDHQNESWVLKN